MPASAHGRVIPWVFHRAGQPVRDFRTAWRKATKAAGLIGRIPHDFRRTSVRNLEGAGAPRSTAMKMVGHRTQSIYRRYAIVDEAMLRDAGARLAAFVSSMDQVRTLAGSRRCGPRRLRDNYATLWRRARDSNPQGACAPVDFKSWQGMETISLHRAPCAGFRGVADFLSGARTRIDAGSSRWFKVSSRKAVANTS